MTRDEMIRFITWTMKHYGSDAGERAEPGSKLRSQAEFIADTLDQLSEAERRFNTGDRLDKVHMKVLPWHLQD